MRILLVNGPTHVVGEIRIFPIHVMYLGSALMAEGHDVRVVDMSGPYDCERDLAEALAQGPYDMIGVSFRNLPVGYWLRGFETYNQVLRRLRPHAPFLVAGGAGMTLFADLLVPQLEEVDCVVVGEGEVPLTVLARNPAAYKHAPGVAYREAGRVVRNPRAEPLAGNAIPMFRDIPGIRTAGYGSYGLQSYRGCPLKCDYCSTPYLHGDGVRRRDFGRVLNDMRFYYDRGVRRMHIIDAEFNLPWRRSAEFLDFLEVNNPGLTWDGFLRPHQKLSEDYIEQARRAGNVMWHVDIVSGDAEKVKALHPGFDQGTVKDSVRVLQRAKAPAQFYFTFALTNETITEELETLKLMWWIVRQGVPWKSLVTWPDYPYPNLPLWRHETPVTERDALWHVKRALHYTFRPSTPWFVARMMMHGFHNARAGSNLQDAWT